jgi:hypothetical protein
MMGVAEMMRKRDLEEVWSEFMSSDTAHLSTTMNLSRSSIEAMPNFPSTQIGTQIKPKSILQVSSITSQITLPFNPTWHSSHATP